MDRHPDTPPIRWLHLSDFHVGKDVYAQGVMFTRIHRHVREVIAVRGTPDFVFVTGDLAQGGKDQEYATFYKDFLGPLAEVLGSDWDGAVYTIPGNHDVDRSVAKSFERKKTCHPNSRFFDADSNGSRERKTVLPRFRAYMQAEKQERSDSPGGWLDSNAGAFSERREVHGRSLGIVGVNTAWLCRNANDRHQLTPGIAILEEALDKIRDCEVCIVLGHHPLDWLRDDHLDSLRAILGQHHTLYLHGHLHRDQGQREDGAGHGFLAVQAGACFQARDGEPWINGLLWAELDIEHRELRLQPRHWNMRNHDWPLTSGALPEAQRQVGGDWWRFTLPTVRSPIPTARLRTPSINVEPDGGFTVLYNQAHYDIPHSLFVSRLQRRSREPRHWKRVHTLLERHLKDFTNLQSHIMVCKANAQERNTRTAEKHRHLAVEYLHDRNSAFYKTHSEIRDLPLSRVHVMLFLRNNLLPCWEVLKQTLASPPESADFKAGIRLADGVTCLLWEALHIADQVLEDHFRHRERRA